MFFSVFFFFCDVWWAFSFSFIVSFLLKIISSNSAHHILLSNLFINNKISKIGKLMHPIVVDKLDNIVWVPGLVHAKLPVESFNGKVLTWMPV